MTSEKVFHQVKIPKDIFTLVLLRAESYFSRSKFNPWRSYVRGALLIGAEVLGIVQEIV